MDVVWMAKLFSSWILRNKKGQAAIEYILLLGVMAAIWFAIYNNRQFKDFISGSGGLMAHIKSGIKYSYRYGRSYTTSSVPDVDGAMAFEYQTKDHDTYYSNSGGESRFFSGKNKYP